VIFKFHLKPTRLARLLFFKIGTDPKCSIRVGHVSCKCRVLHVPNTYTSLTLKNGSNSWNQNRPTVLGTRISDIGHFVSVISVSLKTTLKNNLKYFKICSNNY